VKGGIEKVIGEAHGKPQCRATCEELKKRRKLGGGKAWQ